MLPVHVTSKDLHTTHTDTQRKERLIHCRNDHIKKPNLFDLLPVWHKIKLNSLCTARQHHAVDRQNHDQTKQTDHHRLTDLLDTVLQSHGTDQKAQYYDQCHPKQHSPGISKHIAKLLGDPLCIKTIKVICQKTVKITDHPASHCCVKHHDHIITK